VRARNFHLICCFEIHQIELIELEDNGKIQEKVNNENNCNDIQIYIMLLEFY
jgi:hypothetical protein